MNVYLDNNATTKIDKRVLQAMLPYFEKEYGNPHSLHFKGLKAKEAVEKARVSIASLINAQPDEIIFTSCGSESNNLAIKGIALLKGKGHIISSEIEHPSILKCLEELKKLGFEISLVKVDKFGRVNPEDIKKLIRKDTILISIMMVNNEIGTIEPIKEIAKISKKYNIPFHTDAVQAVGKIKVDVKDLGVDLLSLSAHKFYGPKGIGALYKRKDIKLFPLISGHHENELRGGTLNTPGIVGLGKAAEIAKKEMGLYSKKIEKLCKKLEDGIKSSIKNIKIIGHKKFKIYNTLNVNFLNIEGESLVLRLSKKGICVSTGSACASGTLEPSHVLIACGISKEHAHSSIRFSLGKFNTEKEIDYVLKVLPEEVEKLRELSPFK